MNSKPTCKTFANSITPTTFFLVLLMGILPHASAQLALERDINRQPASSLPADLIELDGYLYFRAGGKIFFRGHVSGQGDELRVYDIETNSLLDIPELYPGPASSTPGPFHAYEGEVFFTARTQAYGHEVMVFNPADNSVSLLHDINPSGNSNAADLVTLDNTLYLTANDGLSEERKLFSYNSDSGLAELAGLDNEGNDDKLCGCRCTI